MMGTSIIPCGPRGRSSSRKVNASLPVFLNFGERLAQEGIKVCYDCIPWWYVVMALIADVMDIMLKHAFVGIADLDMGLSLIQHSTRLFLANHISLA
jgi:hypothetical protein